MKDRYFLDTNIFVYTFDRKDSKKNNKAKDLIQLALRYQTGLVSYQVIQEFVNVANRILKPTMSGSDITDYLDSTLFPICKVYFSRELIEKGLRIIDISNYGWYDSLIIAAAIESGSKILYSEDMQHGQVIEGVEIINPFLEK